MYYPVSTVSLEDQLYADYLKHPKNILREEWGNFLTRYPWQWFFTLTFVVDVHKEEAEKKLRVWVSKINRSLFGRRWAKKGLGVYWVASIEYQKRGVLHFHGVMSGVEKLDKYFWQEEWKDLDVNRKNHQVKTGIARILPINDIRGTCFYVTKYLSKEGEVLFSDNLKAIDGGLFEGQVEPQSTPSPRG